MSTKKELEERIIKLEDIAFEQSREIKSLEKQINALPDEMTTREFDYIFGGDIVVHCEATYDEHGCLDEVTAVIDQHDVLEELDDVFVRICDCTQMISVKDDIERKANEEKSNE